MAATLFHTCHTFHIPFLILSVQAKSKLTSTVSFLLAIMLASSTKYDDAEKDIVDVLSSEQQTEFLGNILDSNSLKDPNKIVKEFADLAGETSKSIDVLLHIDEAMGLIDTLSLDHFLDIWRNIPCIVQLQETKVTLTVMFSSKEFPVETLLFKNQERRTSPYVLSSLVLDMFDEKVIKEMLEDSFSGTDAEVNAAVNCLIEKTAGVPRLLGEVVRLKGAETKPPVTELLVDGAIQEACCIQVKKLTMYCKKKFDEFYSNTQLFARLLFLADCKIAIPITYNVGLARIGVCDASANLSRTTVEPLGIIEMAKMFNFYLNTGPCADTVTLVFPEIALQNERAQLLRPFLSSENHALKHAFESVLDLRINCNPERFELLIPLMLHLRGDMVSGLHGIKWKHLIPVISGTQWGDAPASSFTFHLTYAMSSAEGTTITDESFPTFREELNEVVPPHELLKAVQEKSKLRTSKLKKGDWVKRLQVNQCHIPDEKSNSFDFIKRLADIMKRNNLVEHLLLGQLKHHIRSDFTETLMYDELIKALPPSCEQQHRFFTFVVFVPSVVNIQPKCPKNVSTSEKLIHWKPGSTTTRENRKTVRTNDDQADRDSKDGAFPTQTTQKPSTVKNAAATSKERKGEEISTFTHYQLPENVEALILSRKGLDQVVGPSYGLYQV